MGFIFWVLGLTAQGPWRFSFQGQGEATGSQEEVASLLVKRAMVLVDPRSPGFHFTVVLVATKSRLLVTSFYFLRLHEQMVEPHFGRLSTRLCVQRRLGLQVGSSGSEPACSNRH